MQGYILKMHSEKNEARSKDMVMYKALSETNLRISQIWKLILKSLKSSRKKIEKNSKYITIYDNNQLENSMCWKLKSLTWKLYGHTPCWHQPYRCWHQQRSYGSLLLQAAGLLVLLGSNTKWNSWDVRSYVLGFVEGKGRRRKKKREKEVYFGGIIWECYSLIHMNVLLKMILETLH